MAELKPHALNTLSQIVLNCSAMLVNCFVYSSLNLPNKIPIVLAFAELDCCQLPTSRPFGIIPLLKYPPKSGPSNT